MCCNIHNPELTSLYMTAVVKTPHQVRRSHLPPQKEISREDKEHEDEKDQVLVRTPSRQYPQGS